MKGNHGFNTRTGVRLRLLGTPVKKRGVVRASGRLGFSRAEGCLRDSQQVSSSSSSPEQAGSSRWGEPGGLRPWEGRQPGGTTYVRMRLGRLELRHANIKERPRRLLGAFSKGVARSARPIPVGDLLATEDRGQLDRRRRQLDVLTRLCGLEAEQSELGSGGSRYVGKVNCGGKWQSRGCRVNGRLSNAFRELWNYSIDQEVEGTK